MKVNSIVDTLSGLFPYLKCENLRHSWVKKELLLIQKNHSILDAGAGECRYSNDCKHLKYTSQDFGKYNGAGDGQGLQTKTWNLSKIDIISDIISIPVAKSSFDNILCTEVLEHIPYPDKAIKEFSRILKKDGKLILTAPFCAQVHFSPFFYCTGFSKYWYERVLKDSGMEILKLEFNGDYYQYVAQELIRVVYQTYKNNIILALIEVLFLAPALLVTDLSSRVHKNYNLCFGIHIVAKKL
jgi:ubiquinone/menaquinone biosynthesis C-methylase UbiE